VSERSATLIALACAGLVLSRPAHGIEPDELPAALDAPSLLVPPAPFEPVPGQCSAAIPVRAGLPIAPALIGVDGLATCSAVAVPLSLAAELSPLRSYAAACAAELRDVTAARDVCRGQLAAAQLPEPRRASTQRWIGRVESALVLGIAGGTAAVIWRATARD